MSDRELRIFRILLTIIVVSNVATLIIKVLQELRVLQ